MKASPRDQRALLDLAELDSRIRRAEAARANPPHAARVKDLLARRQTLSQELTGLLGARDDLRTEVSRIESDVAVVDARRARDTERLAATSNVKEAQGLESELASLARRKSDLEDAELEVMERLEAAEQAVAVQEELIARTNAEGAELSAAGKAAVEDATRDLEAAGRDRRAVADGIAADLVALYDKLASRNAGAGLLTRNTCGGCHMVLSGTDLGGLRRAEEDEVVMCPECGCILVRTEESGL
ncbi:C4-type zinc ribbon domain-containing protein [Microbacterium sp. SSW1-59]|uniref:zinc ribbon domain-containing protein n=1 Tax=Microbacterium xanthum TaxID=3079794 RepID=UPI002AD3DF6E|nr:C4-type zinc ribbon domain-containing protein [Microbacterium sp. SSW1-59]MDZ8202349.1 C4-type zinc ribbon domain-containing protein [Microbacterium sp. SSW1-59]